MCVYIHSLDFLCGGHPDEEELIGRLVLNPV